MMHVARNKPSKVLIVNDRADCGGSYGTLFSTFGFVHSSIAEFKLNPRDFKLIVFTGGSDIAPQLYNDTSPKGICRSDSIRDIEEIDVFKYAKKHSIKMVGICRGMQFLNVMTGGRIMHDIQGHSHGEHRVSIRDSDNGFNTNSFHHQMCIPHLDTEILAWSRNKLSQTYIGADDEYVDYIGPEVEAIYSSRSKIIGVQWHPEVDTRLHKFVRSSGWFKRLVKDFIDTSPYSFRQTYLGINSAKIVTTEMGLMV